jgi:hypothetical protein
MLTSTIVGGLFPISVSIASNFMDWKKIINNFSQYAITFTNQENAFVQLPNSSGFAIDHEDTF